MQQIKFTVDQAGNSTMFFIIEEAKKEVLIFHMERRGYCEFLLL